jgi:hypothetical protein
MKILMTITSNVDAYYHLILHKKGTQPGTYQVEAEIISEKRQVSENTTISFSFLCPISNVMLGNKI